MRSITFSKKDHTPNPTKQGALGFRKRGIDAGNTAGMDHESCGYT